MLKIEIINEFVKFETRRWVEGGGWWEVGGGRWMSVGGGSVSIVRTRAIRVASSVVG